MRRKAAVPTERSGHRLKPVLPETRLLEQFVVRYLGFKFQKILFIFGRVYWRPLCQLPQKSQLLRAIPKTERDEVCNFAHQPA
jgi:hypothetical protein